MCYLVQFNQLFDNDKNKNRVLIRRRDFLQNLLVQKFLRQVRAAEKKAIQALKDVKNVFHRLRPAMIDALGVVSSLRELFREIQQAHADAIAAFKRFSASFKFVSVIPTC